MLNYRPFAAAAAALRGETTGELRTQVMAKDGRTVFYAFGAALGLLLDQEGTDWRDRYLAEKFYLEKYRAPRRNATNDAAGAARRSSSPPG